jgi:hypothetical protein
VAGGLVRIVELLSFDKNRCEIPPLGGAYQKNPSFLKGKHHSHFFEKQLDLGGLNSNETDIR